MQNTVYNYDQQCTIAFLLAESQVCLHQQQAQRAWLAFPCKEHFWLELKLSGEGFHTGVWKHREETFWPLCITVSPHVLANGLRVQKCSSQRPECCQTHLTPCPGKAQGMHGETVPTLMCLVMSTSQGRMLHRRLSFMSRHCSLSLEILVEMPSPQVFEQGLQGEVWTMQFFCQASSSPSYAAETRLTTHYSAGQLSILNTLAQAHYTFRPLTQIIKSQWSGSASLRTSACFVTSPPHPLCRWPTCVRPSSAQGWGSFLFFLFVASHKGVLVWGPQVLPQRKHFITEACTSWCRKRWDLISPWRVI